ncbi:TetR family transcriptional regulator [Nocardia nova]|uniref:TetR family transcriptional regulator n=1 Tax=Nocardia nova TaxID=37330 RepID=A0A2S6AXV3_9NOCA|nr:TetR/AcrR family transcriptional regulator [Nocardia nova]PPJ34140.1 TetR family transcriptional regulator [Nocardia nova]PPJ40050.1 TetR family transcriptional regulator [Nocardia nova]
MSIRVEAAARTRAELVDAGLRLAGRFSLAELSANRVVAEAGVSKGTFFHHFPNRVHYLLALHESFHDRIDTEIATAIADLPPGRERLRAAQRAYLDSCLRNRGVRALLLEARAERAITDQIRARNERLARVAAEDFRAMGWSHPFESALLWIGLVVEAALLELEETAAHPAIRAALEQYLTVK